MTQPDWKLVANLGDANPFDHGGKFVYVDRNHVYPPELAIIECISIEDDEEMDDGEWVTPGEWEVYRISLDPCHYGCMDDMSEYFTASPTNPSGTLGDNKYHPHHPAWFCDSLGGVASCMGTCREELIANLCSEDPIRRAFGYIDLIGYYGPFEFDQYPLKFDYLHELFKYGHDFEELCVEERND